jgi:hypothetical protein
MSWRLKRINAPQRHGFGAYLSCAGAHDSLPSMTVSCWEMVNYWCRDEEEEEAGSETGGWCRHALSAPLSRQVPLKLHQ